MKKHKFLLIGLCLICCLKVIETKELIIVNDDTFQTEIIASTGLTLVNVSASWCGPCQKLAPIIKELAEDKENKTKIVKIDFDACPTTAEKLEIEVIPTVILFKDGKEIGRFTGLKTKAEIIDWISETNSPNPK